MTRAEREDYNRQSRLETQALRTELEDEWDMKGHPKADLLWTTAWEQGHSEGLQSVANWYEDLGGLVWDNK